MPEQLALPAVMHRSQLLAAGTTSDEIRTALRRDEWQAVHRGTYCTQRPWPHSTVNSSTVFARWRWRNDPRTWR
jgi:hypothetical protein